MKVTYNWLKDFVEIRLSPQALADKLTMAGLEVTALTKCDGDFVFEIEATSNRPDWLSVIGIAREVAAITGRKFAGLPVSRFASSRLAANRPTIVIEDRKDCPLYTAKIIRDCNVGPAPDWMRRRLELVGCRSVNNIVGITNYVLFNTGEPLHAFDLDKIVGQLASSPVSQLRIIVRRAKNGEEIVTIDGEKRILSQDILVIAAGASQATGQPANRLTGKPIAIAGVIGGKDTEVDAGTKNILLEAAIFNALVTRRVRRALGVQTESSYRFERGINTAMPQQASNQAAGLIEQYACGRCEVSLQSGSRELPKRTITLDTKLAQSVLGMAISAAATKRILSHLGFTLRGGGKAALKVEVPSFRGDVAQDVDLLEELARISGYENIPSTLPGARLKKVPQPNEKIAITRDILVGLGLQEVITYSLVDRDDLKDLGFFENDALEISNPLSQEQSFLRTTLLPGIISCLKHNLNQQQEYLAVFEMAKGFSRIQGAPTEEMRLGIGVCGVKTKLLANGLLKDASSILHLKGIVEVLCERLGIGEYGFKPERAGVIALLVQEEKIGVILPVGRGILESWGIKNKEVFVLELALEKLFSNACMHKKFKPLPQYPSITRDISLVVEEEVPADNILTALRQQGLTFLQEIKISDFYQGKQIAQGFKGLTLSCVWRCDERTLTESEIAPLYASACALLKERFAAKIR